VYQTGFYLAEKIFNDSCDDAIMSNNKKIAKMFREIADILEYEQVKAARLPARGCNVRNVIGKR